MTDIYDQATEREEKDRAQALLYRHPVMVACCACHNCGESLRSGMLFCGAECRDDFEQREKMKKISP